MSDTKTVTKTVAIAALTMTWSAQSAAHHGPSYCDFDQTDTLKGVLIDVQREMPRPSDPATEAEMKQQLSELLESQR